MVLSVINCAPGRPCSPRLRPSRPAYRPRAPHRYPWPAVAASRKPARFPGVARAGAPARGRVDRRRPARSRVHRLALERARGVHDSSARRRRGGPLRLDWTIRGPLTRGRDHGAAESRQSRKSAVPRFPRVPRAAAAARRVDRRRRGDSRVRRPARTGTHRSRQRRRVRARGAATASRNPGGPYATPRRFPAAYTSRTARGVRRRTGPRLTGFDGSPAKTRARKRDG